MSWNRKRTQLQAYFGGLFDGEGSVGIYHNSPNPKRPKHGESFRLMTTVKMTEGVGVGLMKKEYPEAVFKYVPKKNPKHHATMEFILYGNNSYRFLKEIKPFVLVKWEQVRVALSYLVHFRRDHGQGGLAAYPCKRCERFAKLITDLKVPEDKGKKTVNLLIEHQMREYRGEPQQVVQDVKDILIYYKDAEEAVETRLSQTTDNKTISLPEQEIVQTA